jgi:hypothetical protein
MTTPLFLFLFLFLNTVYITVTHLSVIPIINRWWWLSSWSPIVRASTEGRFGITTPSFLSFLSTSTPWHCCCPWIIGCETNVYKIPETKLARMSVEARCSKAIGTKLAKALRPPPGGG